MKKVPWNYPKSPKNSTKYHLTNFGEVREVSRFWKPYRKCFAGLFLRIVSRPTGNFVFLVSLLYGKDNHQNVDISKHFRIIALLKRQREGYHSKTSKILTRNHINHFLDYALDNKYLMMKVTSIVGVIVYVESL